MLHRRADSKADDILKEEDAVISAEQEPEPNSNLIERNGLILWSCIILFVLGFPFVLFVFGKIFAIGLFGPGEHKCDDTRNCAVASAYYIGLNWLAIASCAALFGAIGSMVSVVLRRDIDEQLFKPSHISRILLSGAIFAILMLAIFIGGFVQGNLFPAFSDTKSWLSLFFRVPDWGKLVVWSFVAGFSERLVPNFFDRLVDRFNSNESWKREE
jgi:hypothetical protein